jgi:hypothetical protein
MMTEERIASRIRQALNHNLDDIPPTALRRMEAARHHALSRQKQLIEVSTLVTAGSKTHHREDGQSGMRERWRPGTRHGPSSILASQ